MSENIVSQNNEEVKCTLEGCHEDEFRRGLCFRHFVEEETAEWDDRDAVRRTCLEGVGYVFGDPALDGGWWGDPVEEVAA